MIILAGVALLLAGVLLALGPAVILTGLLLTWAGIIKVVVVHLWRGVAAPEQAVPFRDDERRRSMR